MSTSKYIFEQKTILIVEDDQVSAELLKEILEETGAKLLYCTTATESINLIEEYIDIDLVLMDMKLPKKTGFFATQEILKIRDIPIIAQTAYALEGDKEKCLEAGCIDYLSKPLQGAEILECVKQYL